ncbi:hypothetical protein BH24ACT20_BH24ACT20_02690 [soil metagenome]
MKANLIMVKEGQQETCIRGNYSRFGNSLVTIRAPKTPLAKRKALVFALSVAALVAVMMLAARPAHADTFTVNSTGDGGDQAPSGVCNTAPFPVGTEPECTLRAAIEEANTTAAPDTINFNIGGSGVKTISPTSFLPIVTEPVTINGYSEPGATENTLAAGDNAELRVRLNGTGTQSLSYGLFITADDSVVRGLSITNFTIAAIRIATADNNTIEGNFVGITPSGEDAGNGDGISIAGNSATPPEGAVNNTVGGATPRARNVISGNDSTGVAIGGSGTTGNKVMGNYIGTTKSGTGDRGNSGRGAIIYDSASGNTIGDDDPTDGLTAANTIAFNGGNGVQVSYVASTGNRILSNSIFSNAGLGIDLGGDGVTPNDGPGDADTGPNNLQNFPVISSAVTSGTKTTIKGTLEGLPSQSQIAEGYTIQFFSNPKSANDEGKKYIGERIVFDTDGDGIIPFAFEPPNKVKEGLFVTATATNNSTGDTSEFSKAVLVKDAVKPTVTPLTPKPGSKTRDTTPTIRAKVTDKATNLAKSNIRLFVDGKRKANFAYNRSTDRLTYKAGRLSFKRHTVRIVARDAADNVASKTWRFTVKKRR